MSDGPSREDIVFGRAVIAFHLATKEQVEACAADQKRLHATGRPLTLAQVMVGRKFLSIDQYRRILQEIQARTGQTPQQPAVSQPAVAQHSATGRPKQLGTPSNGRVTAAMPANGNGGGSYRGVLLPPEVTASGRYSGDRVQEQLRNAAPLSDE
ncbi:MAG: hypothetical protein ACAI25_20710, partial [Planctomycetota bacterium]